MQITKDNTQLVITSSDEILLKDMQNSLIPFGFQLNTVTELSKIIETIKKVKPELFILDVHNNISSEWEILNKLRRSSEFKRIPIVLLLEKEQILNHEEQLVKVNDYIIKPIEYEYFARRIYFNIKRRDTLQKQEKDFLETLSIIGNLAEELQIKNEKLENQMHLREETIINIMKSMTLALDAKDSYTAGHSARVAILSKKIGQALGLSANDLAILERGAILHDIGKLIVELSYISKPGPLSPDEFKIMTSHPEVGAKILAPLDFLKEEILIAKRHHEAWDGSGYPEGLKGDEIGLLPTIVTVADVYDALTSDRSYRSAWAKEIALQEIIKLRGTKFNPLVVDTLIKVV